MLEVLLFSLKPQTEPPDALQQLHKVLFDLFPFCDELSTIGENGFSPHLTVGQFTSKKVTEEKQLEFNSKLKPIIFVVDKIYLISRSGDNPFTIKYTLPFGQAPPIIDNNNIIKVKDSPEQFLSNTDQDIILISDRILNWLHHQKELNKIPKTFNSLKSATQDLCKIPREIISPQDVYDKLLLEGYFTVSGDEVIYNKSPWDQREHKFNPTKEEEVILNKCRQWITQPKNSPKFTFGLKNAFRQLVTVSHQVSHEEVLNLLEKIGSIRRGPNGKLVVNI